MFLGSIVFVKLNVIYYMGYYIMKLFKTIAGHTKILTTSKLAQNKRKIKKIFQTNRYVVTTLNDSY